MTVFVCVECWWDSWNVICVYRQEKYARRWVKQRPKNGWPREYCAVPMGRAPR